MDTHIKAAEIKNRYEILWMGLKNVTSVGTGKTSDGKTSIVISLAIDDPETRSIFPAEIEDIPLEFRISGDIDAQ
jgi:hypothetical protein